MQARQLVTRRAVRYLVPSPSRGGSGKTRASGSSWRPAWTSPPERAPPPTCAARRMQQQNRPRAACAGSGLCAQEVPLTRRCGVSSCVPIVQWRLATSLASGVDWSVSVKWPFGHFCQVGRLHGLHCSHVVIKRLLPYRYGDGMTRAAHLRDGRPWARGRWSRCGTRTGRGRRCATRPDPTCSSSEEPRRTAPSTCAPAVRWGPSASRRPSTTRSSGACGAGWPSVNDAHCSIDVPTSPRGVACWRRPWPTTPKWPARPPRATPSLLES